MYVHLHCHWLGSYSDGLLDPDQDLSHVRELGFRSIAITDHGEIAYCLPFYHRCRELGIHPLIGCEVYFVEDARRSIERHDPYRNHLILLAKDNRGFINLVRLMNASWLENNYGEARGLVDWNLLERFYPGLVALSACFWGSVPQKYLTGGLGESEREFQRFYDLFGPDFHPELGRHGIAEEEKANQGLIELSRRHALRPVVTNDCHYRTAADWRTHDVLIKTRFGYATDFQVDARNYYLKNEEEMRALGFPPEYYDNTVAVAEKCRVELERIAVETPREEFSPEAGAVFFSRLVTIDARQAVQDAAGVLEEDEGEVERVLSLLPEGMDLRTASREIASFREWMERRPFLRSAAEKLEGLPRRSEPDTDRIVAAPLPRLREALPLKRSGGEIMAQYPPSVLAALGVPFTATEAFRDRQPSFFRRVRQLAALESARSRFRRREYEAAVVTLRDFLAGSPDSLEARYLLGHALYFLKRYREAIAEYKLLEERSFDRRRLPLVLTRMGWSYNWAGEAEASRRAFARALEVEENYHPAHYALGIFNFREGKYPEAARHLGRSLEIKPDGKSAEKARSLLKKIEALKSQI